MLLDDSIASEDNWIWKPTDFNGVYGELNSGWRWREAAKHSGAVEHGFDLMPVILYTDASHPDFRKGLGLKPIVVQCGNYIGAVTRTRKGKRCVGYWPELKVCLHIAS